MKLKKRQTILVGLAFLSISAFWQMYDGVIPLILEKTFNLGSSWSGVVMAADNVLALFLLPFFGGLSDRTHTKIGKRMPFIIGGTAAAVIFMNILPLLDNSYAAAPSSFTVIWFIVVLAFLLISMGTYRSPAVALMPDVTSKPLRSKGNAVINLMGAVGGVLFLISTTLLYPDSKTSKLEHVDYRLMFFIVSIIMVVSVIILAFTVNENKLSAEVAEYDRLHPDSNTVESKDGKKTVLSKDVKKSLLFMLLSVALWYMGYNAVISKFTVYVEEKMGAGIGSASAMVMVATVVAIISFIPLGMISSKIGRKKTIMFGVTVLTLCFCAGYMLTIVMNPTLTVTRIIMMAVFALVGVSWSAINVNSFPMVVEMCKESDTGKFTGYYYAFSMSAQVITPILSGILIQTIDYAVLFPYAAFFVMLSFITMMFVKHGDSKVEAKKGLEAFDAGDD